MVQRRALSAGPDPRSANGQEQTAPKASITTSPVVLHRLGDSKPRIKYAKLTTVLPAGLHLVRCTDRVLVWSGHSQRPWKAPAFGGSPRISLEAGKVEGVGESATRPMHVRGLSSWRAIRAPALGSYNFTISQRSC